MHLLPQPLPQFAQQVEQQRAIVGVERPQLVAHVGAGQCAVEQVTQPGAGRRAWRTSSGRGGMNRPRALDLYCGAGGATRGLQLAGFEVWGVDHRQQPRYCGDHFVQADALAPPFDLREFDFIWASPPCQAYSAATPSDHRSKHPQLIDATRVLLIAAGVPWVIENVPGAPLRNPVILCGSAFGLKVRRHRWFETPIPMLWPPCSHRLQGRPIDVTGHGGRRVNRKPNDHGGRLNAARNVREARDAMGMEHGTYIEVAQAIPPAYSHFIAQAALRHIGWTERAAA